MSTDRSLRGAAPSFRHRSRRSPWRAGTAPWRSTAGWSALGLLALAGCGGGGGSGGGSLRVEAINVTAGASNWRLNQPIRIRFDRPVDPASVTTGTINVREPSGAPAFGSVGVDPADPRAVVWRPDCPLLDDLSDAGLAPGTAYVLSVVGSGANAAFTVRGVDGTVLEASLVRDFRTPDSTQPSELFVDEVAGPPRAVVRAAGSALVDATRVEVNGTRHYFERQVGGGVELAPPLDLPLNLLSDPGTRVELFLQFDQSVDMRSTNLTPERLRWEFERAPGDWRPLTAAIVLDSNCTEAGAVVRLVPQGLLPPGAALRAVVDPAFRDIAGHPGQVTQLDFAPARTGVPSGRLADHYLEEFDSAARLDPEAPFAEPQAAWGTAGTLSARSGFEGLGGPGADFDWKVSAGEILLLSTVNASIVGGPGYAKQTTQPVVGGVVDVRDLWIQDGAVVRFSGPNPVVIQASGSVRIDGLLDVGGTSSPGVNTLNTTSVPEPGAPGQCGGGRGGTGSPLIATSSARGGSGAGAYGSLGRGGEGGETGWAAAAPADLRRGAGGGGGRLGENVPDPDPASGGRFDQQRIGLDGEDGFDNDQAQNGAVGGLGPARGGSLGPSPFVDGDATNDFFGALLDPIAGRLVVGELKTPWAGAGGGAGGDAARVPSGSSFPAPSFDPMGDEKGAGGGGGGGSLRILALGDIAFGANGRISCRGGSGGGGENPATGGVDRIGGGSGGGSGGHVILETAGVIDFRALPAGQVAILATGGQGGAGKLDKGGAYRSNTGIKETVPTKDACPAGEQGCLAPAPGGALPAPGAGGDGGPGLVQLHTSGGLVGVDLLVAPGETLASVSRPPPLCPLGTGATPGSCHLVPTFGRTSRARSTWIALGDGGFDAATGSYRDVRFRFGGIHPVATAVHAAGDVMREASGTEVLGLAPLVTARDVQALGRRLAFDATALAGGPDAIYLEQPALLRDFLVELVDTLAPTRFQRFAVVAAQHDAASGRLTVDLDPAGPPLESFGASGPIDAELQPAYFRISTDGVPDALPLATNVTIHLDATSADALGQPALDFGPGQDEPWIQGVTDVDDPVRGLNFPGNRDLRFVRFEVLFDRSVPPATLTPSSPVPALEFFRLGFEYP